jgi:eukaryotic-like serine/threonine-protein kinase
VRPERMALQPGQPFGNYRIVRLLGEGGFGEVYLVQNPLIDRRAAVKVLHAALAQDAELVRRFLNEARAASAIRHPNIIEVFDAGSTPEGAPYILMEFLEGVSLHKRLADVGRLALPQVLEIASQAGSALAAAHAAGIVHRDLKPENLFLVPSSGVPGGERVKILDFGIAKIKGGTGTGGTVRTQSGFIMGSPAYMSPEQCKDSADVDLRSDIYSFATIVYEMLAGRTPHVADSGTQLLIKHLTETPRPLRELDATVPVHVETAVKCALARDRADRFDSMASFLGALRGEAALGTGTAGSRGPAPSEDPPPVEASPLSRAEQIAGVPASTTFSRATGEMGASASDETLAAAKPRRRWMLFAFGGVAVAGLALVLALLPSRHLAPQADTVTTAAPVSPVAPVRFAPPEKVVPVALPSTADAGVASPAIMEVPAAKKRPHAAVGQPSTPPATKKNRKSEEEWFAH